ncbi:MAG: hypothetical protein MHM6MM_006707 [Cercozoa sp. M6MM]
MAHDSQWNTFLTHTIVAAIWDLSARPDDTRFLEGMLKVLVVRASHRRHSEQTRAGIANADEELASAGALALAHVLHSQRLATLAMRQGADVLRAAARATHYGGNETAALATHPALDPRLLVYGNDAAFRMYDVMSKLQDDGGPDVNLSRSVQSSSLNESPGHALRRSVFAALAASDDPDEDNDSSQSGLASQTTTSHLYSKEAGWDAKHGSLHFSAEAGYSKTVLEETPGAGGLNSFTAQAGMALTGELLGHDFDLARVQFFSSLSPDGWLAGFAYMYVNTPFGPYYLADGAWSGQTALRSCTEGTETCNTCDTKFDSALPLSVAESLSTKLFTFRYCYGIKWAEACMEVFVTGTVEMAYAVLLKYKADNENPVVPDMMQLALRPSLDIVVDVKAGVDIKVASLSVQSDIVLLDARLPVGVGVNTKHLMAGWWAGFDMTMLEGEVRLHYKVPWFGSHTRMIIPHWAGYRVTPDEALDLLPARSACPASGGTGSGHKSPHLDKQTCAEAAQACKHPSSWSVTSCAVYALCKQQHPPKHVDSPTTVRLPKTQNDVEYSLQLSPSSSDVALRNALAHLQGDAGLPDMEDVLPVPASVDQQRDGATSWHTVARVNVLSRAPTHAYHRAVAAQGKKRPSSGSTPPGKRRRSVSTMRMRCTEYPEVCENHVCWARFYKRDARTQPQYLQMTRGNSGTKQRRKESLLTKEETGAKLGYGAYDRDEVPMASTREGGCFARLQFVVSAHNQQHGRELGAFYRKYVRRGEEFNSELPVGFLAQRNAHYGFDQRNWNDERVVEREAKKCEETDLRLCLRGGLYLSCMRPMMHVV